MIDDKPWLSLPDEEPPERGFAELMAAARAKAEIMTSPPWWKTRWGPVVALATAAVIGSSVLGARACSQQRERAITPSLETARPAP